MCNNMSIAQQITEKDRPILEYLADISLDLHSEGYGFELGFHFTKNPYFKNEVLKKSFPMKEENQVERAEGTVIEWTPGSDVTKQKKKKGKGKNKKTVVVKAQSFFNFFETVEKSAEREGGDDDDEDEDGDEGDMQLEDDLDLGTTIKDDLVPLALEYYLNVIPQEEADGSDDDMDSDGSEEDEKPAPKKGKGKGPGGKPEGAAGADGKKEQECKQQ